MCTVANHMCYHDGLGLFFLDFFPKVSKKSVR